MKVLKILNNNFILVKNAKGQEEIIMGRGLRFKTQVGGCLEEKDVERRFVSGQGGILKDYSRMIEGIPQETLEVIQEAVDAAGSSPVPWTARRSLPFLTTLSMPWNALRKASCSRTAFSGK